MMKRVLASALLGSTLLTPALAQQEGRWYGAVDLGTLKMENTIYADPIALTVSGGYRFSRFLAAEGGVTGIGDSTVENSSGSRTARQGDTRFLAVGYLPLNPSIELFGKAGIGLHTTRIRGSGSYSGTTGPHTTSNVIVGAGVQLNFNQRFSMRMQYESLGKAKSSDTDPGADLSRLSVGAMFHF